VPLKHLLNLIDTSRICGQFGKIQEQKAFFFTAWNVFYTARNTTVSYNNGIGVLLAKCPGKSTL